MIRSAWVSACLSFAIVAAAQPPTAPIEFMRVRVPDGRIADLPLGDIRHVPMAAAAFDRAVARLGVGPAEAPITLVPLAEYDVAFDSAGTMNGGLEFELGAVEAGFVTQVPLGRLTVGAATVRTADGAGQAEVFGVPGGGVAVRVAGPGRYACRFARPAADGVVVSQTLPLLPALATAVRLRVPSGLRPVIATLPASPPAAVERDGDAWMVRTAGADALLVRLVAEDAEQPRVRVWTRARISGRRVELSARIVPESPWLDGSVDLVADDPLTVVDSAVAASPSGGIATARGIAVAVPPGMVGTREPLEVSASAPIQVGRDRPLPLIRAAPAAWAGGGVRILVDPSLAVEAIDLSESAVVGPADAAAWPIATSNDGHESASDPPHDGEQPALVHVEPQSPAATITLRVGPRPAEIDVGRVTTVEVSPGVVVGRAACDVRVRVGEAFGIVARIAPGWFIDAVEAVSWEEEPRGVADPTRRIDWRVDRSPEAAELRIDLAEAATRNRELGLRITGHRRGVPIGGGFVTSDMDMVRFEGESPDSVLVDYRVGPEAVIEVGGSPVGILAAEGTLARLVEPGGSRGRIRGGIRAASRDARLVRRRPPLDADVQVQAVARDGQLAESATFVCRPDAGAIDSIVVHFSAPLGDTVQWSLLKPEGTTAVPRRLDTAADVGSRPGVAESWLVEFRPAVEQAVTFRAVRTLPFTAAVPVTLAWVEGATEERGTLLVRGAGGVRPAVVNRRLWELPPEPADTRDAAGVVAEFRYAGPDSTSASADGAAAAELEPVPSAEARAWAWTARTTAWCHESGRTEFESVFDVENRGRGGLTLSVPRGLEVQEILVAGEPAAFDGGPTPVSELRIDVPQDRVRCDVVVRGVSAASTRRGFWWVDPTPFTIDAPVLGRSAAVMIPVALDLVGLPAAAAAAPGLTARLFDAVSPATLARGDTSPETFGFRRIEIPSPGPGREVCVVRRDLLVSLAVVVGGLIAGVVALVMPGRPLAVLVAACAAAGAALWVDPPLLTLARAAWWGVLGGTALAIMRLPVGRVAGSLAAAWLACATVGHAAGAEPYRVYMTEEGAGGTALVPEPLFRLLAADDAAAAAAVQIRRCVVEASRSDEPWSVTLDLESAQGGLMFLRQDHGGRWSPPRDLPVGVAVEVSVDGAEARLATSTPGRRRITLGVTPGIERRGLVEYGSLTLPPAATATVAARGDWQCDRCDGGGPWVPAAVGSEGFEVSGADAMRLVRSVDARHPLAGGVGEAVSRNDVTWSRDAARLEASFEVDGGRSVVRAAVVQVSPGLVPVSGSSTPAPGRLPAGRWVVEVPQPRPGRITIDLEFELPLPGPVGVFDVPFAWLERPAADARTSQLRADPEFDVTPEPPSGGRIAVRRRPPPATVSQKLDLEYASDQVGMTLEAEIESLSGPLTTVPIEVPADVVIDGFSLRERDGEDDRPVDVVAARSAADRLSLVAQRPRPGRFQLRVSAHVPSLVGRAAPMPLLRTTVDDAALAVSWRSAGDVLVDVAAESGGSGADVRELAADSDGPLTMVTAAESRDESLDQPAPGSTPPGPDAALGADLADVTVHAAVDGRGRVWGIARFELTAGEPLVTLRMPPGIRPFDVLVDGREARAVPRGADTWDVALHDIRWPRTILVVFAGDVGGRLERGDAVRLDPPRVGSGAGREVLWTIDAPDGMRLRTVDPIQPLDEPQWRARGETVRHRMAEAFDAALENVAGPESGRLAEFARRRRLGEMPTLESSWERGFTAGVATRTRLLVAAAGDGSVTIRAARAVDPSTGPRALATAAMLGAAVITWIAVMRWPQACRAALHAAGPWILAGGGLAWIVALRPVLPGLVMVIAGGAAVAARLRPAVRTPAVPAAAEASTQTLLRG